MDNHNHKIFLVDDDEDDLEVLTSALKTINSSYEILQAHNGIEALRKLREMNIAGHLPCLVVLDINMPKMDGKQTLVALQQNEELSSVPIVIFSTTSNLADQFFFQKKNVEMITKPVGFIEFEKIAEKLLGYCKA